MRDLEAEMAKALEGQFFWEHTASPREQASVDAYEIILAQQKFQTPKKVKGEPTDEEKKARLQAIVESMKNGAVSASSVCHLSDAELRVFANYLTKVIADIYGVTIESMRVRKSGPGIGPAKHHLSWAMLRYFPAVSLAAVGRAIDRNHSTIIHSCKKFDEVKDSLAMQIAAVDAIVGMPG